MNRIKYIISLCVISTVFVSLKVVAIEKIVVKSPNNKLEVFVTLDESIHYSIKHSGQVILDKSTIGMQLSDGKILGFKTKLTSKKERQLNEEINSPFYRSSSVKSDCNELNLRFKDGLGVIFRVYNQGVTYRLYTSIKSDITITDEIAEFKFDSDYTAYLSHSTNSDNPFAMAFQNIYEVNPLSQSDSTLVFLPITVDVTNGKKVTITESDLESYPGMFLKVDQSDKSLKGVFASYPSSFDYYPWRYQKYIVDRSDFIAKTSGSRTYPWRIIAISERDTEMPVNDLVYLHGSPNRIGDASWVKPGKVAWEWWNNWGLYGVDFEAGINMNTYKYYIDFASRFGIEYIVLDEGWYDPKSGDMMTVIPQLNLKELIEYGEAKGVGIVLWTVFNVLDSQLEEACSHYSVMGIKGFKIDFLDRDDQEAVEMTYRIAEETAKHKLFINLHGFYKPTGINRTYPHIINFEGVFGMEEAKWSTVDKNMPQYNVTFPFIRMMAGPVDFTPGAMRNATKEDFNPIYNNPMSQGTRCHQLAMYVVHDSPFTMLCDSPTLYERESDYTAFLSSIPVVADETKILQGELGEYIVTGRRKDLTWYVGGMSNWTERDLKVELSFLEPGINYNATVVKDGPNAHRQGSDYMIQNIIVNSESAVDVHMAPGGGFVIKLEQLKK